jgi:uncharacterized protein
MTFGEFLLANNEKVLWSYLTQVPTKAVPQSLHDRCSELIRDYFYVGGMPEAVFAYTQGKRDFISARKVQKEIIESYRQDVRKYAEGKLASVILEAFDRVAFTIGEKTKYSRISSKKASYVREALELLSEIFIIHKVYHSSCYGLPLAKGEDTEVFKLFLLDVGLYHALMDIDWREISKLTDEELLNKGQIAEQFIAQHLLFSSGTDTRPRLHYWLRDKKSNKAEIDFVLSHFNSILPLEVKAGKSGKIKSLLKFMSEKNKIAPFALRMDLQNREVAIENVSHRLTELSDSEASFKLLNLPLYRIEQMKNLILKHIR